MQTRFVKRAAQSNRKFANFLRAKERIRLEHALAPLPDEPEWTPPNLPKQSFVTITIRHSEGERTSFRVRRSPFAGKLLCMKRCEAASAIGKRVAVVLENMLPE